MKKAIGTSTACGFVIALIGTVGFVSAGWNEPNLPQWSSGYVFWPGSVLAAIMSLIFAKIGTYFAHRLPSHRLKQIFSVFLLLIGIHLLIS